MTRVVGRQRYIAIDGIYLIDPAGKLAADFRGDSAGVLCPSWSSDSRRLAYCQSIIVHPEGNEAKEEGIYVMDADGKRTQRITFGPDEAPSWSPDSRSIVFSRFTGVNNAHICRVDVQTKKVDYLTNDRYLNTCPAWSGDGSLIAFTSNRSGIENIWLSSPNGSKLTLIPHQPHGHCGFPVWCPIRSEILFTCASDRLYGWPARLHKISPQGHLKSLPISRVVADHVAWSPDGAEIAFLRSVTERSVALFIASSGGQSVRQIYPPRGGSHTISWPSW